MKPTKLLGDSFGNLALCVCVAVHPQTVVASRLPSCHSVDWDSIPLHGLCPWPKCEALTTVPPLGTARGYTVRDSPWRCIQRYLFSCKASLLGCPDPADLWADLWDLLPFAASAHRRTSMCAWHIMWTPLTRSPFAHCTPWFLSPSCTALPSPGVMLCARFWPLLFSWLGLLLQMPVPVGSCVFASGLLRMRSPLSALVLPLAPRVAGRCPLPFSHAWIAEAEAPLG
jgi:hypothetical protein